MTAAGRPRFSLVVATLNRPALLARLLDSVAAQEAGPLQVVVVDQSDAAAAAENAAVLGRHPMLEIVHLRQDGRGLSRARNLGLPHACGELVAFPDDDCWYRRGLLAEVGARFAALPGHAFLSGRYDDPAAPAPRRHDPAPADLTTWNAFLRAASVTLFFRAEALAGERFDERLGAGSALPVGEEIDLVLRLLRRGRRGRYLPDLVVYHPVVPFDRGDGPAYRRREAAYGYVLARHALAGCAPAAARLGLGIAKAALRSPWSAAARHSLAGRCQGIAAALATRPARQ